MTGGESTAGLHVSYFTNDSADRAREWLSAVVVWRHPPRPRAPFWTGVRETLRGLFTRPLRPPAWEPPSGWQGGSAGGNWERLVLWSPERGIVRLLERDIALPPGERTLVVLVEETEDVLARVVRTLVLELPTVVPVLPVPGPAQKPDVAAIDRQWKEAWFSWRAALQAHPVVGPFWTGAQARGAA